MIPALIFWISLGLILYVHCGYPLLLRALAARRAPLAHPRSGDLPAVSILVVARDEAERIVGRLENLLALDYPCNRLEILVGSDGSADRTAGMARWFEGARVRVVELPRPRGKPAVLNDLVPMAGGEIVVFADARQRFEAGALRAIVRPFQDPKVGAVSGELVLTPAGGAEPAGRGIGLYWRYEKSIRSLESRIDSTVGATGAFYAIRRGLFEPLPEDTLLDDVLVPMRIVRRGYRVLFEAGALAFDRPAPTASGEFTRKVRTLAGNFQLFAREPWLLSPIHNRLFLQTLSHKLLRLLNPLLLAAVLGASIRLAALPLYRDALVAQMVFYAAALAGGVVRLPGSGRSLLAVPYTVCLLNCATVVGFFRFVSGRQKVTWERASG